MMAHNPKVPLLTSFALLAVSAVGTLMDGLWSVAAFIVAIGLLIVLLLQSDARIETKVDALEVDVRGLQDRESDDCRGARP